MKILPLIFSVSTITVFAQTQTLTINITNIQQNIGTMRIGVYDPYHGFGSEEDKPAYFKLVPVTKSDNMRIPIELPAGRYAVAIYQDLNDNKKMDKSKLGFPKEPYGFSRNYRPKFSAPKFEDCAIELGNDPKTISIKLLD